MRANAPRALQPPHTARTNTADSDTGRFHLSSVFSLLQLFKFTLIPQIISYNWEMLSKQVLNPSVFSLDQTYICIHKPSRLPLTQTSVSGRVTPLGAEAAADPRPRARPSALLPAGLLPALPALPAVCSRILLQICFSFSS